MTGWRALSPWRVALAMVVVALIVVGCETRSISNSGYRGQGNPFYKGELTEFDVLGIDPARPVSNEDIAAALASAGRPKVRIGSGLLVVQSGAAFPDDLMMREFGRQFSVTPFSGIPLARADGPAPSITAPAGGNYAGALRLAAARAGNDFVICYWGVLESAREGQVTKVVSWVPLVGMAIPDETQRMRIRMKIVVIDVRTGAWSMFVPDNFEDTGLSAAVFRAESDQTQVALLKEKAYKAAVADFVKRYAP